MNLQQHKAEMISLHTNLMDAQSKVKKDIKLLTEKRDLMLKNLGGEAQMNDGQKHNYEMFCRLIENQNNLLIISQAGITKYRNLYEEVIGLVKSDFVPAIKRDFVEYLHDEFNGFIFDSFLLKVANGDFTPNKTLPNDVPEPNS